MTSSTIELPPSLVDRGARGQVLMLDRDRAALLQRLSTNDVLKLAPGQGTQTVLTNHNGRIIDLLTVLALPEQLLLLTGASRGPQVAAYLRKNIFFMDQVRVEDRSAEDGLLELYGAGLDELLARLADTNLEAVPLFGHVEARLGEAAVRLVRIKPIGGSGWALSGVRAQLEQVRELLVARGLAALDEADAELLRVRAGLPAEPELNLEYIPLEVGLWDAVSFKKGCYVGQEIIARMESRGRLAKRLMGLRLEALPEALPARLEAEGKDAGDLTSAVLAPGLGPIGLGFVRTAHAEPGAELSVAGARARVVELPFAQEVEAE